MAEIDFNGFGSDTGEAVSDGTLVSRSINFIGAVLSIGLIAGLAVWGYELLMRDVTGVPVVQALDGPMRVAPDDPGGEQAAHLGLSVNRIAALGDAAPPAERIVLAPRSADLEAEDLAQAALRLTPELVTPAGVDASPASDPSASLDPVEVAAAAVAREVAASEALLSAVRAGGPIPASVPGVARSIIPKPRPEGISLVPASYSTAADEIDPATLPPGTKLVQFSAHDEASEARAAWTRLEAKFGALLQGKERVIEEASNGGRVFFRLRAMGFADDAESRRFCAAIIAEGADCIAVTTR